MSEVILSLRINSSQALALINLITLRLEFLVQQRQSSQVQVECQALRAIVMQIRDGAQTLSQQNEC